MATRTAGLGRLSGIAAALLIAAMAAAACTTGGATASAAGSPGAVVTATDTAAPRTAAATPATPATPAASPTVAGACPTITTSVVTQAAPDGTWTVSFKKPVVSGVPAAVATAINDAITAKVTALIHDFNGVEMLRREDGLPNTLVGEYAVGLCSGSLLGLRLHVVVDNGGAHPFDLVAGLNFRVSTGATIHLADLFTSTAAALPVLATARDQLLAAEPDLAADFFWPASPALSFYENCWMLSSGGVYLSWDMGDIAPTAAGVLSTTIPWSALRPALNPAGPAGEFA
jgi:hypothetical protein